jgi:sugar lactone lactonase YvrE
VPELQTLMTGISFGESPRWHDDRLWFADWGAQELIAVDLEGKSEVIVRVPSFPFCTDWLPDGRLLIVSALDRLLLRREPDGSLVTHTDLSGLSEHPWNEIVVTPDNSTLIVAESYGNRLTAFEIASDGSLSNQRVWADLGDGVPDGICLDAEGAVWYADVPNKRCVRVREGGEVLQTIDLDRGCFACMLGGLDRRTLFMVAREWRGLESTDDEERTGQLLTAPVPTPGAGWP